MRVIESNREEKRPIELSLEELRSPCGHLGVIHLILAFIYRAPVPLP